MKLLVILLLLTAAVTATSGQTFKSYACTIDGCTSIGNASGVNVQLSGDTYYAPPWAPTGSPTCAVTVESSSNASSWTKSGVIASQNCGAYATTDASGIIGNSERVLPTISGSDTVSLTVQELRSAPGTLGNAPTQIQINNTDPFGAIAKVAAGSALTSEGPLSVPVFQIRSSYAVRDYGFVCNGATSNNAAAAKLLNIIGSTPATVVLQQDCELGTITFPGNVTLDFSSGGSIKVINSTTITILGGIVDPDLHQIFYNALGGQGTIDFAGATTLGKVYPEWWGASPSASASVNTPALQAAEHGAFGTNRTNGSGLSIYNRPLYLSGRYKINGELQFYHVNGFEISCANRLSAGIVQTATNQRIIDGQSISYGVFENCGWSTTASQDPTRPLIDLDYDGTHGADLRPQFIDFWDNNFSGGGVAAVGLAIAKSGGGAQGSNISCWDCEIAGFTEAGERIGLITAFAYNALDNGFYAGDMQGNPRYGIEVYGGQIIVRDTSFEDGFFTQTGYDVYCYAPQQGCTLDNARSESLRLFSGGGAAAGVTRITNSNTIFQARAWYNPNGGACSAGSAISSRQIGHFVSGTGPGGDGAYYRFTSSGVLGGLCLTNATSGSASAIVDSAARWTTSTFVGQQATIVGGAGVGQFCIITANSATTLSCSAGWVTNYVPEIAIVVPDNTSQFVVEPNWGATHAVTSSGTVGLAYYNFTTVNAGANTLLQDDAFPGGQIGFGANSEIKNVQVSRADWGSGRSLDSTFIPGEADRVTIVRPGSELCCGLQNAYLPWYPTPRNASSGQTFYSGPTQDNKGTVPIVWSVGELGGGTSASDVWIGGRSDANSVANPTRAILEFGGMLGRAARFGTNLTGTDTDITGGPSTGNTAGGAINFWTSNPGISGATANSGLKRARINAGGQIESLLATGTAPFAVASTTVVPNLNVSQLLGGTWAVPGTIGSTTPNTGAFTTISTATNCTANSASPAACGSASSGAFVVPTTTTTYTVDTTAVTAVSRIFLFPTTDASNLPSRPICVAPASGVIVQSARVAATSFTVTLLSTTGTTCFNYWIVN
jgi:hypothetical protein